MSFHNSLYGKLPPVRMDLKIYGRPDDIIVLSGTYEESGRLVFMKIRRIRMNNEFMNSSFYQNLPKETKELLKNCSSEEEAREILKNDMASIPDDVLDNVAGGGDTRKDIDSEKIAKDFEEGRITGEEFF